MLTAERLRELLNYDPHTGLFVWRVSRSSHKAGSVAGTLDDEGYRRIAINRRRYRAHRLAWFYVHGVWPAGEIDHKNTDRDANWLDNLRDVTSTGNQQNARKARRNNKIGLLGVTAQRNRFLAAINVGGGKKRHLGSFKTADEAHQAYLAAKRRIHPTCTI